MITEHTDTMSLVHHDRAVVLMLQFYNLGEFAEVTFHREHAIHHNQLNSFLRQLLEHTLQIVHIVVLVMQLTGKRKAASVHNRSVVTIVANDIVVLSYYHSQYTLVYRETC